MYKRDGKTLNEQVKKMKVGIFGGSFDPVHKEHIHLAQAAVKELGLDKLLIMPAYAPPHKPYKVLMEDSHRLQMCRLAFADVPNAEVCDFEIAQKGTSYTYLTCQHFKQQYPTAQLFWLVGTDMLRDFPTWRYPEKILSTVTLAVCARNEQSEWVEREQQSFFKRFGQQFTVLSYQGEDVSSTKIRVLAAAQESVAHLVGEAVQAYIQNNGLYLVENVKQALALEKPQRKAHSLRVAEVAAKKAGELRMNEKQAIAAALFHDCGKNVETDSALLQGFTLPAQFGEVPAQVVHQFTGAYLAQTQFGVTDEDILNAVRYHTSGRPNMSALEKLIFLADMVEEERNYDVVESIRSAFWSAQGDKQTALDACLLLALEQTAVFLRRIGQAVYPLTLNALQYYQQLTKKEKIDNE